MQKIKVAHPTLTVALTGIGALLSFSGLSGCALYIKTNDGTRIRTTSAEFSDYAGRVFRFHNQVTTNLAYTLDELEAATETERAYNDLVDADDRMLQACSAVDDVAIARRNGEKVSLKKLNEAAKHIPDCESATLRAEKMIAALDPG